jgi:hypothetical protein
MNMLLHSTYYGTYFFLVQGELAELPAHLLGVSAATADYLHVWLEVRTFSSFSPNE